MWPPDVCLPEALSAKDMAVQNLFLQQPSEKAYVLQVRLVAGEPVDYRVLLQRVGWPDTVYEAWRCFCFCACSNILERILVLFLFIQ